jgi:hypothetical protein
VECRVRDDFRLLVEPRDPLKPGVAIESPIARGQTLGHLPRSPLMTTRGIRRRVSDVFSSLSPLSGNVGSETTFASLPSLVTHESLASRSSRRSPEGRRQLTCPGPLVTTRGLRSRVREAFVRICRRLVAHERSTTPRITEGKLCVTLGLRATSDANDKRRPSSKQTCSETSACVWRLAETQSALLPMRLQPNPTGTPCGTACHTRRSGCRRVAHS